ncbi:MAG: zinc-dependent metalloprotease [Acidimicrobiia bacterium]
MTGQVPWPLAVRVAGRVVGSYPLADSYHAQHLLAQLGPIVERAGELVAGETGLAPPGAPGVAVVSRLEWVDRNVASFSTMLGPAERRIAERLSQGGALGRGGAHLARRLVAAETGALLGVMARRVLGQYELVLPIDGQSAAGPADDSMAFVGANILSLERTHQFRPSEFRMWLALHECAHRAQFVGVPWLRGYFFGLVEELVGAATPEPGRWQRIGREVLEALADGRPLLDERGLLGLFASPTQQEVLGRVQALMSLLEGHGHVVMDRIGARELVTQQRMSRVLKMRRTDPRTAAFFRITGLEMKLRQYELGERFVLGVEELAGWRALDRAWEGPQHLPDLDEIEHPDRWLARVA